MEWQPIETAPKDGAQFVARGFIEKTMHGVCNREYFEVSYSQESWGRFMRHISEDGEIGNAYLTHWMPLPPPPSN